MGYVRDPVTHTTQWTIWLPNALNEIPAPEVKLLFTVYMANRIYLLDFGTEVEKVYMQEETVATTYQYEIAYAVNNNKDAAWIVDKKTIQLIETHIELHAKALWSRSIIFFLLKEKSKIDELSS